MGWAQSVRNLEERLARDIRKLEEKHKKTGLDDYEEGLILGYRWMHGQLRRTIKENGKRKK